MKRSASGAASLAKCMPINSGAAARDLATSGTLMRCFSQFRDDAIICGGRGIMTAVCWISSCNGAGIRRPPKSSSATPQRVPVRATGHHHRPAEKLRSGQARDPAECRTPAAPLPEQSGRKLSPTDAPPGTAHAGVQICRAGSAIPLSLWSHRPALAPTTPPLACARLPSSDAATIAHLAGAHELADRRIRDALGRSSTHRLGNHADRQ
jgi:hypothetical protein